jgi:Na+-translocating ferredoxin:NAD+ oxidoreductase RnfC subunit
MYCYRRVPLNRLIDKLGLSAYRDYAAPLNEKDRLPNEVRILLQQHVGVPATPTVKEGAKVKRGDRIASIPDRKLGGNLHASIEGKVSEVTPAHIRVEAR